MRTTLKRGIGRAETNGHAPVAPLAVTPMRRYATKRRSRLRLVGKIFVWLLVAALVAAGALAGGFWLYLNHSLAAVQATSPEARAAEKVLDVPVPGRPAVAIVIGYDKRLGKERNNPPRSDTLMLVRVDPDNETISMLSFPRDLVVDIPGCRQQGAFSGRINEAFTACGPRGTLETVKQLTGISVNYMVTVDFRGFTQIVNKVGGVYMDVDRRYFNDNEGLGPGQTYDDIDLHAGYQHLNGKQALDFVRYRHTDSDIYRNARQQEFIKAFKQQVESFWSLRKIPGVVNAITSNVEVGVGGGKALDPEALYGYARLLYELPTGNFHQVQIEGLSAVTGANGAALLAASDGAIDKAVQTFMAPDAAAAEKATAVATGRKPKRTGPAPETVTIEVLNGNGVVGSADEAAFALSKRGYRTVNGGNAERFDYFHTTVSYDPARPNGRAAANAVAQLFGDAELEAASAASPPLETTVRVVVGQTFHGTIAPVPPDTTPKHEPPAVVADRAHAAPLVRRAQRKVDFRVLVPTVREKTSSLDDEEPMRTYRMEGEGAVRLVYRTSTGEYWGIQQTGWSDAPITRGASLVRRADGREYHLYYAGSRLHVVAFEEGGALYWVVNTLLNRLSNETMLALAKGLKPLSRK
ncbi:MAG TPA: LCP family protein [Gaiellaceae bacterium]|nr:LCP family protein [Gaiellaceae bacterium]